MWKAQVDTEKNLKADHLYWHFRYSNNSYKARKAGIRKIAVMAKYGSDRIRLYGEPDQALTVARGIFRSWKQRDKDVRRADKELAKQDRQYHKLAKQSWQSVRCPGASELTSTKVALEGKPIAQIE